jgi:HEAT repeat protein
MRVSKVVEENLYLYDVSQKLETLPSPSVEKFREDVAALAERGVNSYDTLFSLMRDLNTDMDTLLQACHVLYYVRSQADQRRATPALLSVLKRERVQILQKSPWLLSALSSRHAVPFLMEIVKNRNENAQQRIMAISTLSSIDDDRPIPFLSQMMFDEDEHLHVRWEAIEWLSW